MDWMEAVHQVIGREGTEITWWQMSARAVVIFAYGLFLVRLAGRRVFGQWAPLDIVVSLIIGSNLSRALTGTVPLVQTLIASTVLVLLHALISAIAVRWPPFAVLVKGRSVRLVSDGQVDHSALRRNGLGPRDLEEALRTGGVAGPEDVQGAWLERNGAVSVVKRDQTRAQGAGPDQARS
jgi:uncharacterized membrane protein YcaP (DUF421 family)